MNLFLGLRHRPLPHRRLDAASVHKELRELPSLARHEDPFPTLSAAFSLSGQHVTISKLLTPTSLSYSGRVAFYSYEGGGQETPAILCSLTVECGVLRVVIFRGLPDCKSDNNQSSKPPIYINNGKFYHDSVGL